MTLASAVLEALRLLSDDPEALRKRAVEAVENLIIFGDLLELNQVTVDDPSVKGTWLFAAPPSFVVRPSGSIFVLGIVPDEASPLPASLNDRIMYEGFTRMLVPDADENLPAILNNLGLREISLACLAQIPTAGARNGTARANARTAEEANRKRGYLRYSYP